VDNAAHARRLAGRGELARQFHVHLIERLLAAVQDAHQVDHRVMPGQQGRQARLVLDVGLDDVQVLQVLHAARVVDAPRGHRHREAVLGQFFAQVAANEAGTAQNEDFFHDAWNEISLNR
jgi:hypothetical protein